MQPICIVGNAGAALIVAAVSHQPALSLWWWWLAMHLGGTCAALGIFFAFDEDRQRRFPALARVALRLTALGTGTVWALGAFWWPLGDSEAGLAVLLCIAGLAAAGSSAWAADPAGLMFFLVPAFAPYGVLQLGGGWLGVLLVVYVTAITIMALGNLRLLREMLGLRWSNDALLEHAIRERESAELAQRRAESAGQAKTRFLAAASHDLRQPVQALRLFVDVLEGQPGEARRTQATAALGRTSRALSNMLESLLDLSRLDAGLVAGKPQPTAILPLLEDTAAALADDADAADMVVRVVGPPLHAEVDPVLLTRVVQNLASNAVRHARRGRVLLSIRRSGADALLQVWDQGPGIDEQDRARIFEEFVQLGNRERDRRKGLGLGLSMVKRICALCDWSLSFQSRPGHGTVFSVRLPLAGASTRQSSSDGPGHAPLHVVLVDDDIGVREALVGWLSARGCRVHPFGDARSALDALQQLSSQGDVVDVLVTDHGLPGEMEGAELVRALRKERIDLPTVVLTGAVEQPFGDELPTRAHVLRKPASAQLLWQAIQKVTADETGPVPSRSG